MTSGCCTVTRCDSSKTHMFWTKITFLLREGYLLSRQLRVKLEAEFDFLIPFQNFIIKGLSAAELETFLF